MTLPDVLVGDAMSRRSTYMCADICIHDKNDGNPHTHIMLTMRPIEKDGKWGQKSRTENGIKMPTIDWNEHTKAEDWRAAWADICNQYLERNNVAERIDHRSYERQGLDIIPTVHLGVAAFQMEKRGIRTERGNVNREIEVANSQIRQLKARISKLKDWLKEEAENLAPPTLADVFEAMVNKNHQQGRYKQIADLKTAAKTLAFLQENNIMDMAGLQEKVSQIYSRHRKVGSGLNAIEKRLKVLDEHIKQAEYYRDFKPFNDKYKQMKPKHQEIYFEAQRRELILFQSAQKYFAPIMKGRTALPLKDWKDELAKLTAEKKSLYQEYHSLKDEVREVEIIRRNVEDIMREKSRGTQRTKTQGMEL